MKLSSEQLEQIKQACENVEYGSVTIKINTTAKYIDLVVEKQIRIQNSTPTKPTLRTVDKKYS